MYKKKYIYVVGDVHGDTLNFRHVLEYLSLDTKEKGISLKDVVVVYLGDFGFNFYGDDKEKEKKAFAFKNTPFLNLVVLGNHENYDEVLKFEKTKKCGAVCYKDPIVKNLFYVENGEILTINHKKYRCYGGGLSIDKDTRKIWEKLYGQKFYREEEIDKNNFLKGMKNYSENKVYACFSHDAPSSTFKKICQEMSFVTQKSCPLQDYFERVKNSKKEKPYWFLGHYHPFDVLRDDKTFVLPIGVCLALDDLINLKENYVGKGDFIREVRKI